MHYMLEGKTVESKVLSCDLYTKPVDRMIEDIRKSEFDKVILTGVRGSGKSTILLRSSLLSVYSNNPFIYIRFDGLGVFYGNVDDKFNKNLYVHYYELKMSLEVLNFIKKNYEYCYDSYFKNLELELKTLLYELNWYTRYGYKNNVNIKRVLYLGEYVNPILKRLKKLVNVSKISLMLDRFDSINNSREISQSILSKYFDIFDNIILVSDDNNTILVNRKDDLKNKGYDVYVVDYGADKESLRGILKNVILNYNFSLNNNGFIFPYSSITDELLDECIKKAKGNITFVLNALIMANSMLGSDICIENFFIHSLDKQIEKQNNVDEMYPKKVLHL